MNSTIPLMAVILGVAYSMMAKKGLTKEQLEMIESRMVLENVRKIRENDGKPKVESFVDAPAQSHSFGAYLPDIPAGALKISDTISVMSLQKPAVEKKDIKLLEVGESKKALPQPTSVPLADIPSNSLDDGTEAAVNISNIETQDLLKMSSSNLGLTGAFVG